MAKPSGMFLFPANFDVALSNPLDSRTVMNTKANLLNLEAFKAKDGVAYLYPGLLVSVVADSTPENNGVYRFLGGDQTNPDNWVPVGTAALDAYMTEQDDPWTIV